MTKNDQNQAKPPQVVKTAPQVVEPAPPATPLRPVTPAVAPAPAAPPAQPPNAKSVRPAKVKFRHVAALGSFIMLVIMPIAVVFYYLYVHAADQYSSETAFSVHKEEASSAVSSLLGGLSNFSGGTSDADVLYQYIQSHGLVKKVNDDLNLRERFSVHQETDPVFGLEKDASNEDLLDFWQRMVTIRLETASGIITVETRSFAPEDSHAINTAILAHSSELIERLSRISQEDTIRSAKEELDTATERLKEARIQISTFRKTSRIIDPNADVQGQMGVLNELEQKLADALIELDLLADVTTASDPRVLQAERKVKAIRNRINEERTAVVSQDPTGTARNNLYATLGTYEAMLVDQEFAEQAYVATLANYDTAAAEARRKSRYLVAHVEPSFPQTAEYPQRAIIGLVLSVFILLSWVLLLLVGYSLRDRR
ncbi:sugar transporter [uncultured Litoreibacter sp.]|uniref:sugar transporter n=3 Tax=uncultured Litoreibacter sp. TaxID=1392394 RepID=UPI00261EE9A4|nr:sugar transporter [uncultured Litoreibacter sp.]